MLFEGNVIALQEGLPDFDTVPKLGGGVFGTGSGEEDLKFYRSVHLEPVSAAGGAALRLELPRVRVRQVFACHL